MSPIDSILGIHDLVVQSVKRAQAIHVWAKPCPACVHCQQERLFTRCVADRVSA